MYIKIYAAEDLSSIGDCYFLLQSPFIRLFKAIQKLRFHFDVLCFLKESSDENCFVVWHTISPSVVCFDDSFFLRVGDY